MNTIKESLTSLAEILNSRMNEFQQDLQKTCTPVTTPSLAIDFAAFRSFIIAAVNTLQRQVEVFTWEFDRLEMRTRRKMLLLHGVPEEKSEDASARVTGILNEHLNLDNFTKSSIKSSYRLGRLNDKKPRPIVVKVADVAIRNKVWLAKTKFKGTGVTQSEFLTKIRHEVFLAARQRFGVDRCWTRDGIIHVIAPDGPRHKIERMSELENAYSSPDTKTTSPSTAVADKKLSSKVLIQRIDFNAQKE